MPTTRRTFLAGAMGAIASSSIGHAASPTGPNVLFIMADDLGYADLSCYGARRYRTSVLDQLASDGVRLTQGYANSPICSPTRVGLLTGKYQQRFDVGLAEPVGKTSENLRLPSGVPTIASAFRDAGYRTALIGKWHVGVMPHSNPLDYGYDHFWGFKTGAADYFSHKVELAENDPADGLYDDRKRIDREGYLTDLLAAEAVRFVQERRSKPFFLSLHFNAPHWPWEGPEDAAISRELKSIFHRDGGSLETYAKMVTAMDAAIGKVLEALDRSGQADNTIVVFTSDNGGERFSDTYPLTGYKGEVLEGGIRVPLILRWPGRIRPGSVSNQVMASMDFLPTLVAATGKGAPAEFGLDGVNLLPVLTGSTQTVPRTLFWRFKTSDQAAVRSGDWKYVKIGGKEFLFDLANDPRERAQLKDQYASIFEDLKGKYAAWNQEMLPYPADSFSEAIKQSYPDRY